MNSMLFKNYDNKNIEKCDITIKVDGVRGHFKDGVWKSRAGKPLYNLPTNVEEGIYEIFLGNWEESLSACRTKVGKLIDENHLYKLYPDVDKRLVISSNVSNVTKEDIDQHLKKVLGNGYEGLVIRCECVFYKVKPTYTLDVKVTGWLEGKGKHAGRMGALLTPLGKVGTGFTDQQRERYTKDFVVGNIIEVDCMELTPKGQFRHPRFIRLRLDK